MKVDDHQGFTGQCPRDDCDGHVSEGDCWRVSRNSFRAKVRCDTCDYNETLQRPE